jgi:hypothetical protein
MPADLGPSFAQASCVSRRYKLAVTFSSTMERKNIVYSWSSLPAWTLCIALDDESTYSRLPQWG